MMNLRNRMNLWKLKREMGPSRAFKASLRKDLSVSWDAKYDNKAPWYQLGMRHAAAGFTAIALILTSAGGAYAYTSSEVTEGNILYPIKEVIENVEEVTKVTPEAKAKFYLKKIERREAERQVLARKNPLPKIKEEIKEVLDVESGIKIDTSSLEVQGRIKIEVTDRKIERTEKAIENIEEQLEKTRQIIEKTQSKDVKLREELKTRAEQRIEKRKKQLEIKIDNQKGRQENLQKVRQNININVDNRKTEVNSNTEIRTRAIKQIINF